MKIKSLQLHNFHGFVDKTIDFSDQFTVLIGDNATGKTAILDGISVALGGYLSGFNGVQTRHINDDEVHLKRNKYGNIEKNFPVSVKCTAEINHRLITWERSLNGEGGKTTRQKAKKIINYSNQLQKDIIADKEVNLPVLSYFGTGRLAAEKREKHIDIFETGSRLLGYLSCLSPVSNTKLFTRWLKKMTYIQLQQGKEPIELAAVRQAVSSCLKSIVDKEDEDSVNIFYDVKEDETVISLSEGRVLPFRMLSDGYRNIIGLVADIAFRMAVLNPHLENKVTLETNGIVLIDEIDLHLHPKWQRHVVDDLKRTFPQVQFIVTTHSPFIIQSLQDGELRMLDGFPRGEYVDQSIEDVTENVMGVNLPQWSNRRREMFKAAEEYFKALQELKESPEKLEELRRKMDRLSKPFVDNVAYFAFLEQERLAAEALVKEEHLREDNDDEARK